MPLDSQATYTFIDGILTEDQKTGDLQTDFKLALYVNLGLVNGVSKYSIDDLWKRHILVNIATDGNATPGNPASNGQHAGQHLGMYYDDDFLNNPGNTNPFPGGNGGGFNLNTFTAFDDWDNVSLTTAPTEAVAYTPTGDSVVLQDDTTNYRIHQLALSAFTLPADSTATTNDGTTGRTITYRSYDFAWNGDGTILWGCRGVNVFGWDLSTAYDVTSISSAIPDYIHNFDTIDSWDDIRGLVFNEDGTKLILRGTRNTVSGLFQYDLSTPYDPNSAGALVTSQAPVAVPASAGAGLAVSADDKTLVYSTNDATAHQLLSTVMTAAFDLSTATTVANTTAATEVAPASQDLAMSAAVASDSSYMLCVMKRVSPNAALRLYKNLEDSAEVVRMARVHEYGVGAGTDTSAIFVDPTGTYMLLFHDTGSTGPLRMYTLSTPYDVSTASLSNSSPFNVARVRGNLWISADGITVIGCDPNANQILRGTMSTPWDISTLGSFSAVATNNAVDDPSGIDFNSDGTKVFYNEINLRRILQHDLSTPYDITTDSNPQAFDYTSTGWSGCWSFSFNSDGTKGYSLRNNSSVGLNKRDILQFDLSTAYDVTSMSALITQAGEADSGSGGSLGGNYVIDGSDEYWFDITNNNWNRVHQYKLLPDA